jgi:hypothetical protein
MCIDMGEIFNRSWKREESRLGKMFAQAKRFMKKIFVKGGHVPGRILKKSKNERESARIQKSLL